MESDQINIANLSFASIVLDIALDKPLDYSIPPELLGIVKVGMRVEVPVRGKPQKGYVLKLLHQPSFKKTLPIIRLVSTELITPELFKLAEWMSRYYCTPLRQVFKIILPASVRSEMKHKEQLYVMRKKTKEELKNYCESIRNKYPNQANIIDILLQVTKGILLSELLEKANCSRSSVDALVKKGFLFVDIVRIDRSPLVDEEYFKTKQKKLHIEQTQALEKIIASINASQFQTHLLFGVTGSGKTEVYMQAIEKALFLGKTALMLVPEISLTAQTIERFRARFDEKIAVLHHRLSQGERFDEWHKIKEGKCSIVIGARSAVFSPLPNLGLIIVDEEHESSYKQTDEQPCYNARDVAVMRGKFSSCPVVLGSATPSFESYQNALEKKYILSELKVRASHASLPQISIIDMKKEFEKANGFTNFSSYLIDSIQARVNKGEQTILFLNRRGYHTTMMCLPCNQPIKCPHCDVSLTFHLSEDALACHLCGHTLSPTPKWCPTCKQENPMKFKGVGTELIEKNLQAIIPGIRTLRVDADTTRHKGSQQKLLKNFSSGKADVLIGTQMIAKGLHFPAVTLVGIINCDAALNIPDFRSSETVFQLITQVAGRAGRGDIPGEVILQTQLPDNSTICLAKKGCYESYFKEEIEIRKLFNFPPFTSMIKVTFAGPEEKNVLQFANYIRQFVENNLKDLFDIHPVLPGAYTKVKGLYRFQFLLRGKEIYKFSHLMTHLQENLSLPKNIRMRIDVNPTSTF